MFLFFVFSFMFFGSCRAAFLYLEPAKGEYYQKDNFLIKIKINTEEKCINTVKADLVFPTEFLKIIDFSDAGSLLNVWPQPPSIDKTKGTISFIGGVTGGFCGILAGDLGETNLLGRIIFEVNEGSFGIAEIKILDSSQVLLNDGLGTITNLKTQGTILNILKGVPESAKRDWQEELIKDKIQPEPFAIRVIQDPSIFENQYSIIFSTVDRQTGIDYYEVKEGEREWKKTVSPYLLEDQNLKSVIKVKAVDKSGNERIVEYKPPEKISSNWLLLFVFIIIGWIIFALIKKKRVNFLCKKRGY